MPRRETTTAGAPPSPGSMAHLDGPAANRKAPSTPRTGAAVAGNRKLCTNREWCPESLVDPDTQERSGRTETLTGQAAHTSSEVSEKEDSQGENEREGTGNRSTRDPDRRRKRFGRRAVPGVSAPLTGGRTHAETDLRGQARGT